MTSPSSESRPAVYLRSKLSCLAAWTLFVFDKRKVFSAVMSQQLVSSLSDPIACI